MNVITSKMAKHVDVQQCLSTGVSYTPGCTRIFQGCTNSMGCTRYVLFKSSHIVSHMSFASSQLHELFTDFKTISVGSVHCLSFPACLFVMLVR